MSTGGQIKKLILNGVSFDVHGDSEGNFNPGGNLIVESETTNQGTIYMTKTIPGMLSGIDVRLFTAGGTLGTFHRIMEDSAGGQPASCLIQFADGSKWTAVGGAFIMADSTDTGYNNIRTGATTVSITAAENKFRVVA